MAKKISGYIKLQIPAGKANPAPPIGPLRAGAAVRAVLRKAAGVAKGSGKPNREKVGSVTRAKIEEIAKLKMADLNTSNLESAMKTIEGTAKSMGISVD